VNGGLDDCRLTGGGVCARVAGEGYGGRRRRQKSKQTKEHVCCMLHECDSRASIFTEQAASQRDLGDVEAQGSRWSRARVVAPSGLESLATKLHT
jgi:hypothetical protein